MSIVRSYYLVVLLAAAPIMSAGCMNHFAIHPRILPVGVRTLTENADRGALRVHLEWAEPPREGRLPTILVHPEAGAKARDMRGVIWDLANDGYLAVAADYERLIGGKYRRTLVPFREEEDLTAALAIVRSKPRVDPERLGLLGFSQGGVYSLLMAAKDPQIKAVIAYYPITDFENWLKDPTYSWGRRLVFRFIMHRFRSDSGASSDAEFRQMLERASPLRQADGIRAPVLLVHGVNDTTAPIQQSRRLAEKLRSLGRDVKLVEIPNAGHVFNFYDKEIPQGRQAWNEVLAFLSRTLPSTLVR